MAQHVTHENCPNFGLKFEELIGLTGIYGVHPELRNDLDKLKGNYTKNLGYINYFKAYHRPNHIQVEFETDKLKELTRRIDFNERFIENQSIKAVDGISGLSLPCLYSQVENARNLGFARIECHAYGVAGEAEYKGHFMWGKYGFQMSPDDQREFLKLMKELGRPEKTLYELFQSGDGLPLWRDKIGSEWFGEFDTNAGSVSCEILERAWEKERQKKAKKSAS